MDEEGLPSVRRIVPWDMAHPVTAGRGALYQLLAIPAPGGPLSLYVTFSASTHKQASVTLRSLSPTSRTQLIVLCILNKTIKFKVILK